MLPMDHDTIQSPEVPEPAVPRSPMDAPAIQDRCATDLDLLDVSVLDRTFP